MTGEELVLDALADGEPRDLLSVHLVVRIHRGGPFPLRLVRRHLVRLIGDGAVEIDEHGRFQVPRERHTPVVR